MNPLASTPLALALALAALAPATAAAEAPPLVVHLDGAPLDGIGPWTLTFGEDAHLPPRMMINGRPILDISVLPSGLLILDGLADDPNPAPLDTVLMRSVIAPFWAPPTVDGCPQGAITREVRRARTAAGMRFAWIDVLPPSCSETTPHSIFSAELLLGPDGALQRVEFAYATLAAPPTDIEPRAGLRFERPRDESVVFELFPDTGDQRMRDRAKWLLDGSSDGVPGVWGIDIGPAGDVVGDIDLDGWRDSDNCAEHFNPLQADLDGDLQGDVCDNDADGDRALNDFDNCPWLWNPAQRDGDGDGLGDACDTDQDGDRWPDALDLCPRVADRANLDLDRDGIGDVCDFDADGDDPFARRWGQGGPDLCPLVFDLMRIDTDGDGLGDWCDLRPEVACHGDCQAQSDQDGDGISDPVDVCPAAPDSDQTDSDGDGLGDACDADANGNGLMDVLEICLTWTCGGRLNGFDPRFEGRR